MKTWIRRTRDLNFSFTLKVPGAITHESLIKDTNFACSQMYQFEKTHLEILKQENKLGAVLIQLPPYFRFEHTDKLLQLLSAFSTKDYSVFVEVRQKELYLNMELENALLAEGAVMVSVDSPEARLEENYHSSSSLKYVRLHGRNSSTWWKRNSSRDEKYDYEYSRVELEELRNTVISKAAPGDQIFIYFNNHPDGKAPRNAEYMMELTGQRVKGTNQRTLV